MNQLVIKVMIILVLSTKTLMFSFVLRCQTLVLGAMLGLGHRLVVHGSVLGFKVPMFRAVLGA